MSNIHRVEVAVHDWAEINHQGMIAIRKRNGWSLRVFNDDFWECERSEHKISYEKITFGDVISEMRSYISRIFDFEARDEISYSESECGNIWFGSHFFEREVRSLKEFNDLLDGSLKRILEDKPVKSKTGYSIPEEIKEKRKRLGKRRGKRRHF